MYLNDKKSRKMKEFPHKPLMCIALAKFLVLEGGKKGGSVSFRLSPLLQQFNFLAY
ncbi:unknown protein [Simkania negevensis Z]|uniref:Uncharacterized protein n=1 Tax=Simkania negevensis (strain ATCC VR-1471 / DSM 27360 / Z) TaxID=331113 RepID=F8L8M1_SIMNZ|nr:unknown protein [Simkania negevensis Z]